MDLSALRTAVLSLTIVCTSGAHATGTLYELYQLALENDPQLKIAEQKVQQAKAGKDAVFRMFLPQISATAQMSDTDYRSETTDYRYTGERYNLTLSQKLFDPSTFSDIERAEWDEALQIANLEYTTQERTAIFIDRYFQTLQRLSDLELSKEELLVTEKNLERIESLFQKQLVSVVAKLEAVAKRDQLIAEIAQLEADLATAQEMLAESVGDAAYTPLKRPELISGDLPLSLWTEGHWRDLSLAQNPILRSSEARIQSAESALEKAENERLPKIDLRLSSQYTNIGSEYSQTGFNSANVVSINLTVPLFLGGTEFAKISAQEAVVAQSQAESDVSQRRVIREVRSAYLTTKATLSSFKAAQTALESAMAAREAAQKSFSFGITDTVAVMESVAAEFAAQKQLNDIQFNVLTSYVNLLRWSGALTPEYIGELSASVF